MLESFKKFKYALVHEEDKENKEKISKKLIRLDLG
jgi:hypothetical protein